MIKFPRILFGDIHEHILEIEKTINDREAFLICDENTSICREKLANTTLHNIPFLTILSGESNKTLEQVSIISPDKLRSLRRFLVVNPKVHPNQPPKIAAPTGRPTPIIADHLVNNKRFTPKDITPSANFSSSNL